MNCDIKKKLMKLFLLLLFFQLKEVELERTKKWLKMVKEWKRYYSGEKVSVQFLSLLVTVSFS